jgi:uncharacterized protein
MAAGLPDLVDCARLAGESATLVREYELGLLPRLKDLLAEPAGRLRASFAFSTLESGGPGARVAVEATPRLECQRCLQVFDLHVSGASEVEFAVSDEPAGAGSERESFRMDNGHASLRDLAEEELLLALPLAPACSTPDTCGRAPVLTDAGGTADTADETPASAVRRPFSGLKELLKKT